MIPSSLIKAVHASGVKSDIAIDSALVIVSRVALPTVESFGSFLPSTVMIGEQSLPDPVELFEPSLPDNSDFSVPSVTDVPVGVGPTSLDAVEGIEGGEMIDGWVGGLCEKSQFCLLPCMMLAIVLLLEAVERQVM